MDDNRDRRLVLPMFSPITLDADEWEIILWNLHFAE